MQHDPSQYGPAFAELLDGRRVMPLDGGEPNASARASLASLDVAQAFAHTAVRDADAARACLAGVGLYHNDLDQSHRISQGIETPTGSFWHGIMHRREPDYSNAKYWFRRVGDHPVYGPLREEAAELARSAKAGDDASFLTSQASWDPYAFVDLGERCVRGGSASAVLCRDVQAAEWWLLFDFSYRQATGG